MPIFVLDVYHLGEMAVLPFLLNAEMNLIKKCQLLFYEYERCQKKHYSSLLQHRFGNYQ